VLASAKTVVPVLPREPWPAPRHPPAASLSLGQAPAAPTHPSARLAGEPQPWSPGHQGHQTKTCRCLTLIVARQHGADSGQPDLDLQNCGGVRRRSGGLLFRTGRLRPSFHPVRLTLSGRPLPNTPGILMLSISSARAHRPRRRLYLAARSPALPARCRSNVERWRARKCGSAQPAS